MLQKGYHFRTIRSVMTICGAFCRRKQVDESSFSQSSLARVLNTFDLTALGVGSTLGVGIYVLAGAVSKTVAGPAVVISFLLAAIASVFAGLCYAEFGARVPKAGSAYVYSYYCVGELVAFIIGWSLILEYVIGSASVAKGISTYINSLVSDKIKDVFISFAPMDSSFMSSYVDFFAFSLCIVLAAALAFGVRESTIVNNFLTFCNLSVVAFIIISGFFKADFHNWQLGKNEIPEEGGEGGFAPFGLIGIIKGAAICFYGFVGFDCIATTGEEVKHPQRAIPLSILISLTITFLAYFGVSSVLTLMWPYFQQDPDAPFPYVYAEIGWDAAKWLVAAGALFGMFSSLFGAMFPLPRIIYAMASDGLLFRQLGDVSPKTKTPVLGTAVAGLVTATMAALFNLQQLISLMALGTLLAYTIVAISVLILRYSPDFDDNYKEIGETTGLVSQCDCPGLKGYLFNYFSCGMDAPTHMTKKIVVFNIIIYSITSALTSLVLMSVKDCYGATNTTHVAFLCILGTALLIVFLSICSQPKTRKSLPFQMPLVPLLPCLSIFFNIYLMVVLDKTTWIKLAVWMIAGIVPYFCWYCWKRHRGQVGENSRYNVNRINNIKLNELVWTLLREKKTLMDGYINEAFVGDVELNKTDRENEGLGPGEAPVQLETGDDDEKTGEALEINNNIYTEVLVAEKYASIAEIHAPAEDPVTCNGNAGGSVNPDEDRSSDNSTPQTFTELINETEVQICSKIEPEIVVKNNVLPSDHPVFNEGIPIRKRNVNQARRGKIFISDIVQDADATGNAKASTITRVSTLLRGDLGQKLNKIFEQQATFIQSELSRSSCEVDHNMSDRSDRNVSSIEIKTLTKSEIINKLQDLFKNGPPRKPFVRQDVFRVSYERQEQEGT